MRSCTKLYWKISIVFCICYCYDYALQGFPIDFPYIRRCMIITCIKCFRRCSVSDATFIHCSPFVNCTHTQCSQALAAQLQQEELPPNERGPPPSSREEYERAAAMDQRRRREDVSKGRMRKGGEREGRVQRVRGRRGEKKWREEQGKRNSGKELGGKEKREKLRKEQNNFILKISQERENVDCWRSRE